MEGICAICGKQFQRKNKVVKYCSDDCRKEASRQYDREYSRKHAKERSKVGYHKRTGREESAYAYGKNRADKTLSRWRTLVRELAAQGITYGEYQRMT